MEQLPLKKMPGRNESDPCSALEKAEFRSAVGNMHWATSQTRWDRAVDASRFQKVQLAPTWGDLKALSKAIRSVKSTASIAIRIRLIEKPCLAVWSDSSLYGSRGEVIDDPDLAGYERHQIHSQWGYVLALLPTDMLESVDDVPFSMLDWRSRSSKRVYHSTLATEANAMLEALGQANYLRAYWCSVCCLWLWRYECCRVWRGSDGDQSLHGLPRSIR